MADSVKDKTAPQVQREARRAAALRENLKRRKQQARARADGTPENAEPETDERGPP